MRGDERSGVPDDVGLEGASERLEGRAFEEHVCRESRVPAALWARSGVREGFGCWAGQGRVESRGNEEALSSQ